MAAPRTNDPLGVSDTPSYVTDPARGAEIVDRCSRGVAHILDNYRRCYTYFGSYAAFNKDLARLKIAVFRKYKPSKPESRLHPMLETCINMEARRLAEVRSGSNEEQPTDREKFIACRKVASKLSPKRGAPPNNLLKHHVAGMMALIQETIGKPVMANTKPADIYGPVIYGKVPQFCFAKFQEIDRAATTTAIARHIESLRKEFAGKPMPFHDFFPLFEAKVEFGDRNIPLPSGQLLETMQPNFPIYCS